MKTRQMLITHPIFIGIFLLFFHIHPLYTQGIGEIYAPTKDLIIKFNEKVIEMQDPAEHVQLSAIRDEAQGIRSYLLELDPAATISRFMPEFRASDTLRVNRHGKIIHISNWSLVYRIHLTGYIPFFEIQ